MRFAGTIGMLNHIKNSVVVITGASSGIGRATAQLLAKKGARLVLCSREADVLRQVEGECRELGAQVLVFPCDVGIESNVRNLVDAAIRNFGYIDVWVNNAAVYAFGKVDELPSEVIRKMIETNILGVIYGSRAILPHFKSRNQGMIINISSIASKIGAPYTGIYNTTKHAVTGFTESLRMELQDEPEIYACTVLPASIDTPLFQHAANYTGRAVKPIKPVYKPEQVADAILNCMKHPEREIVVGGAGRMIIGARRVMPRVMEKIFAFQVDRDHFKKGKSAPVSNGNVLTPMPESESVHGGWKGRATHPVWAMMNLLPLIGIGYFAYRKFSKSRPRFGSLVHVQGIDGSAGYEERVGG